MSYASISTLRRISGARLGAQPFGWAKEDSDTFDRAEEREKALQVLNGTARFTADEIHRILARLVLSG